MAGKACHAFASTTRFGLTQALGRTRILARAKNPSSERTYPYSHPPVLPCNRTGRSSAYRTGVRDQATASRMGHYR